MSDKIENRKSVGVVIFPGVSMLELTGTYSVLNGLRMAKYEVYMVAERKEPVASDTPLQVVPHKTFDELPKVDILVVMGGGLPALEVLGNPAVLNYISDTARSASTAIGIGAGSVALAACRLLQDRSATTHWAFAGLLNALGARYEYRRWVEDGKFITTAGGTGGMDLGLMLVARLAGEKNARILQLFAEYDPQPPFGGLDWHDMDASVTAPFSKQELNGLMQAVAHQADLQKAIQTWSEGAAVPA